NQGHLPAVFVEDAQHALQSASRTLRADARLNPIARFQMDLVEIHLIRLGQQSADVSSIERGKRQDGGQDIAAEQIANFEALQVGRPAVRGAALRKERLPPGRSGRGHGILRLSGCSTPRYGRMEAWG